MAIEKALYELPEGVEEEVLDPENMPDISEDVVVMLEDGGAEITMGEEEESDPLKAAPFEANLAEYMDEETLDALSTDLVELVDSDVQSREKWVTTYVKGMEVLGFEYEERTEPWDNACGVYSNILAEAIIAFQAETMSETFPAAGPVKIKILGEETKEKEEAAERVRADMNYQLTEVMGEYRPEHERLLYSLGLAGSAFKKVYFDPTLGRQTSVYLPAEDVIVPFGASQIETAERVTHIMRKTKNDMAKLQSSGFYTDADLGEPERYVTDIMEKKAKETGVEITDNDDRYTLYEVHADLLLDGCGCEGDEETGIARPYVITIEKGTGIVLAAYRNWAQDDPLTKKRQHFVHYIYIPGFGFYGLGLIHIIGGYARGSTSIIRQLVDAGTLSNLPGGLKTRGMRTKGDDTPIGPGEWRDVDIPSGALKDNFMPLPYKEPSQVLLALLERITQEGRRLGAISEMNISDMSANAPVGTTLALLERTLKPMAAVQSRVHFAMKQEFKLLKAIIAENAPEQYAYQPHRGEVSARQADYAMVDAIPVSDPNSSTMAQRVIQWQTVHQMSSTAPQVYDLAELHRRMIEQIGIKEAEKIVPTTEDITASDPVSENMALLMGKPVKAFLYQDHQAHMANHQAFMQDPMIAETIGQNPQGQQIMASLQAHITEHLAYNYRQQVEDKLGAKLPMPHAELPEEIELQLSRLVSDAGKQLTQAHQQQAAQKQAQEQAQDPTIQLKQQEAATKAKEVDRKAQKDMRDYELAQREQARKERKDDVDGDQGDKKLDIERAELRLEAEQSGARLSLDSAIAQGKQKTEQQKTQQTPMKPKS